MLDSMILICFLCRNESPALGQNPRTRLPRPERRSCWDHEVADEDDLLFTGQRARTNQQYVSDTGRLWREALKPGPEHEPQANVTRVPASRTPAASAGVRSLHWTRPLDGGPACLLIFLHLLMMVMLMIRILAATDAATSRLIFC